MKNIQIIDRQENITEKSKQLIDILEKANQTKEQIYRYLETNATKIEDDGLLEASKDIRKLLEMGSESYYILTDDISSDDIDRTQSMLCGPLYCSKEFPHPLNHSGTKLIPILQIDLKWIGAICGKQLGDGMLQLWFDHELTNVHDLGTIRLIPLRDIGREKLIEFDDGIWSFDNRAWIPGSWLYPVQKKVKKITGVKSFGFTVPESDLDVILMEYYYDSDGDFHEELFNNVSKFAAGDFTLEDDRTEHLNCHLFGNFYPIQMSAQNFFPSSCFVSITDFSDGNAEIFRSPDGGFSFYVAN